MKFNTHPGERLPSVETPIASTSCGLLEHGDRLVDLTLTPFSEDLPRDRGS